MYGSMDVWKKTKMKNNWKRVKLSEYMFLCKKINLTCDIVEQVCNM